MGRIENQKKNVPYPPNLSQIEVEKRNWECGSSRDTTDGTLNLAKSNCHYIVLVEKY